MRLLPPTLLLHHITQLRAGRLTVLTGGPRTVPARQQTLRDTLSWSYNLLTAAEQQLYRRLAVFVGGSTLEAVAAVCTVDGDLAVDVLAGLQALLDNSLLQRREGVAGEPRFTMLETIREDALERLCASGERERLQRQHAAYFVTLAESGGPAAGGRWWDRLEEEHGNFRAALAWSRTELGSDTGLRLAVALSEFWARRGHLREGSGWLAQMVQPDVAVAGAGCSTSTQLMLQARALGQLGVFAQWQGDLNAAVAANAASLALFQQIEEPLGIVNALNTLGMAYQLRGDHERAGACLQESLVRAQALGDAHPVIGWCHFFLGTLAYSEGNVGQAGALWEDSLMRLRVTRDT